MLRVLIADDSVVYRSQIRLALTAIPQVEVVGAFSNGRLALERLKQGGVDLMILDLEMPEMDGLQTLKAMAENQMKCPVLMFSSANQKSADATMEALQAGASDFIPKPLAENTGQNPSEKIRALLEPKMMPFMQREKPSSKVLSEPVAPVTTYPKVIWDLLKPKLIVIGSSTGGPTVLEKIFSKIAGPLTCPIVIAQHMPPIFTASFAQRLQSASGIPAKEAADGERLENKIYIAPGDYHLRLMGGAGNVILKLDQGPQINSVRPAVDPLFESAARIFGTQCLGFILTGMGHDGKVGAEQLKSAGGAMVIQNQESCVVFGMPGAVFQSGAFDRICTPDEIIQLIQEKGTAVAAPRKSGAGA